MNEAAQAFVYDLDVPELDLPIEEDDEGEPLDSTAGAAAVSDGRRKTPRGQKRRD